MKGISEQSNDVLINVLYGEKLDVDVSHGGVDDGAVRHSLGALSLRGSHHLFLRGLLVKDVSVRVCTLRILRLSLWELELGNNKDVLRLEERQNWSIRLNVTSPPSPCRSGSSWKRCRIWWGRAPRCLRRGYQTPSSLWWVPRAWPWQCPGTDSAWPHGCFPTSRGSAHIWGTRSTHIYLIFDLNQVLYNFYHIWSSTIQGLYTHCNV